MLSEEEKKAIRNLENLSEYGLSTTLNQADLDKMKTVLNIITKLQKQCEEKDRKIKKYLDIISKNIIETIKDELIEQKNKEIDLKDKQIDLMAELVYKRFKAELLLEYGFENEEQLKQYFADLVEKE